tara:strand:+ start:110 stop:532 length:423 start_codon:yes stop_codon:yes gene_type:complete
MTLVTWKPEDTLNRFFDTDRFFNAQPLQWQTKSEAVLPKVNVTETDNSFYLEAETPGMQDKDIGIEVHNGILTIKGNTVNNSEKENYHIREFSSQSFERSFRLSDRVDTEQVSAKIKNGILKVDLPKHEQVKPLKIDIQS